MNVEPAPVNSVFAEALSDDFFEQPKHRLRTASGRIIKRKRVMVFLSKSVQSGKLFKITDIVVVWFVEFSKVRVS
jgi:hypothetical protein